MSDTTKIPRAHAELAIKFYSDSKMKCWYWSKESRAWFYVDRPGWEDDEIYEVSETKPTYKPKKRVTMAGITFNAPESVAPEGGTRYWIPHPMDISSNTYESYWTGSEFDRKILEDGLVHLNQEDARLHAKANIKLNKELK